MKPWIICCYAINVKQTTRLLQPKVVRLLQVSFKNRISWHREYSIAIQSRYGLTHNLLLRTRSGSTNLVWWRHSVFHSPFSPAPPRPHLSLSFPPSFSHLCCNAGSIMAYGRSKRRHVRPNGYSNTVVLDHTFEWNYERCPTFCGCGANHKDWYMLLKLFKWKKRRQSLIHSRLYNFSAFRHDEKLANKIFLGGFSVCTCHPVTLRRSAYAENAVLS